MNEMTSFSEEHDDPQLAAARVSQVTQQRLESKWIKVGVGALVIALIFIIGLGQHFLSHHKTAVVVTGTGSEESTHTLEENLAHLRAQVEAEKSKHPEIMQQSIVQNDLRQDSMLTKEMLARMNAPTSVFTNDKAGSASQRSAQAPVETSSNGLIGNSANSRFINAQSAIDMVEATRLPHPEFTIAAGEIIPAVLESAINSDLPGMIRAVISRDVYSLQGAHRLIPKGTRLIGQYSSGIVQGQSRILVVWERVQLSNGVVVSVGSPGTDTLGRAGIGADEVNNHFMQKFATSALLSVMGAYTANAGVNPQDQYNSAAAYRSSVADSFQMASQQSLLHNMNIKPTLGLNQGALVNVFVAHDLSFYNVLSGK